MQEYTGFGMKDCLSSPGQIWKFFISLRDQIDEAVFTYNDKHMRWFLRQSIKKGQVKEDNV